MFKLRRTEIPESFVKFKTFFQTEEENVAEVLYFQGSTLDVLIGL
jgi:hypothetical protein